MSHSLYKIMDVAMMMSPIGATPVLKPRVQHFGHNSLGFLEQEGLSCVGAWCGFDLQIVVTAHRQRVTQAAPPLHMCNFKGLCTLSPFLSFEIVARIKRNMTSCYVSPVWALKLSDQAHFSAFSTSVRSLRKHLTKNQ